MNHKQGKLIQIIPQTSFLHKTVLQTKALIFLIAAFFNNQTDIKCKSWCIGVYWLQGAAEVTITIVQIKDYINSKMLCSNKQHEMLLMFVCLSFTNLYSCFTPMWLVIFTLLINPVLTFNPLIISLVSSITALMCSWCSSFNAEVGAHSLYKHRLTLGFRKGKIN